MKVDITEKRSHPRLGEWYFNFHDDTGVIRWRTGLVIIDIYPEFTNHWEVLNLNIPDADRSFFRGPSGWEWA